MTFSTYIERKLQHTTKVVANGDLGQAARLLFDNLSEVLEEDERASAQLTDFNSRARTARLAAAKKLLAEALRAYNGSDE